MVSALFPSAINKAAALRILTRDVGATVKRVEQLRRLKNTAIQITYAVGKTWLCRKKDLRTGNPVVLQKQER